MRESEFRIASVPKWEEGTLGVMFTLVVWALHAKFPQNNAIMKRNNYDQLYCRQAYCR